MLLRCRWSVLKENGRFLKNIPYKIQLLLSKRVQLQLFVPYFEQVRRKELSHGR